MINKKNRFSTSIENNVYILQITKAYNMQINIINKFYIINKKLLFKNIICISNFMHILNYLDNSKFQLFNFFLVL